MNELERMLRRMQSQLERASWFEERSELIDLLIHAIHREMTARTSGANHDT
jgi:hypothetical protein